jgi:hypothetical protein
VIYHGGFNSLNHIVNIFKNYKNIDGVALASILHYSSLKELNKSNKILEGNNDFITENKNSIKENISISSINDALLNNNVLTNKRK